MTLPNNINEAMQDVMQKMEKEPDKPIPIKPDFSFQKLDDYSLTAEITGVREDRYVSRLSVQNNTDADYMTAWVEAEYIRDIQQYGLLNRSIEAHSMSRGSTISSRWGMLYENNIPIVPPQIEESIAFRMAEQVIETAELRDYVCTGKCVTPFYQHLEDIRDGCPGKYEFIFTRKVNGAAETFMNTAIACGSEEEAVRAEWPYERIHIYVDDQGIFAFLFYGKSKVSQIIRRRRCCHLARFNLSLKSSFWFDAATMLRVELGMENGRMRSQRFGLVCSAFLKRIVW